jgi:hypothetical protein
VRRLLLKVLVTLGTPRRHGCWTELMPRERGNVRESVPQRTEAPLLGGRYAHAHSPDRDGVEGDIKNREGAIAHAGR